MATHEVIRIFFNCRNGLDSPLFVSVMVRASKRLKNVYEFSSRGFHFRFTRDSTNMTFVSCLFFLIYLIMR